MMGIMAWVEATVTGTKGTSKDVVEWCQQKEQLVSDDLSVS
jgi:hypothetical protein